MSRHATRCERGVHTQTHTLTLSLTLTLTLSLTYTHTLTHSLTHTLTHMFVSLPFCITALCVFVSLDVHVCITACCRYLLCICISPNYFFTSYIVWSNSSAVRGQLQAHRHREAAAGRRGGRECQRFGASCCMLYNIYHI
jgi:hypothetical protein